MKKIDLPFITFIIGGLMILTAGLAVPQTILDKYQIEILLFVVVPYLGFYLWHIGVKDKFKKSSRK